MLCLYVFLSLCLVCAGNTPVMAVDYKAMAQNTLKHQAEPFKIPTPIKQKINSQQSKIVKNLKQQSAFSVTPENLNTQDNPYQHTRIYVFISSSIPDSTIQNYIQVSEPIGDEIVFVLRGFVGGMKKIQPTKEYITRLLCGEKEPDDTNCNGAIIDINPNLFETFHINQVPAVVYVQEPLDLEFCSDENSQEPENYWVSYGDANLKYHLAQISKKIPNDMYLKGLFKRFQSPYYDLNKE